MAKVKRAVCIEGLAEVAPVSAASADVMHIPAIKRHWPDSALHVSAAASGLPTGAQLQPASIIEGKLTFSFPATWQADKFDEWSYYRNQFDKLGHAKLLCAKCGGSLTCAACGISKTVGTKAIDIVAIESDSCCWLIEVKDYRDNRREKLIDVAEEVAVKVRDSLAVIAAARVNANDAGEKDMAKASMSCHRLRVVLHLEQPAKTSKLHPRELDLANVLRRLKQLVKGVDPHPLVVEKSSTGPLGWSVT